MGCTEHVLIGGGSEKRYLLLNGSEQRGWTVVQYADGAKEILQKY